MIHHKLKIYLKMHFSIFAFLAIFVIAEIILHGAYRTLTMMNFWTTKYPLVLLILFGIAIVISIMFFVRNEILYPRYVRKLMQSPELSKLKAYGFTFVPEENAYTLERKNEIIWIVPDDWNLGIPHKITVDKFKEDNSPADPNVWRPPYKPDIIRSFTRSGLLKKLLNSCSITH